MPPSTIALIAILIVLNTLFFAPFIIGAIQERLLTNQNQNANLEPIGTTEEEIEDASF